MGLDVRRVYVSPKVRAKLGSKHGVTEDEALDACYDRRGARWIYDDERGWRLAIEGWNEHRRLIQVILYPTDEEGLWNLGSAQYG